MKWLPREKRNPFIIVVLIAATVLSLIWFVLIGAQQDELIRVAQGEKAAAEKLQQYNDKINSSTATQAKLNDLAYTLKRAEEDMASGDLYAWSYNTMNLFKKQYKVDMDTDHPTPPAPVDLLSAFPYTQTKFNITGKAFYHDLGKFIADFENAFPHARIVDLVIDSTGGEGEKLTFRMEIIVLVKPT